MTEHLSAISLRGKWRG